MKKRIALCFGVAAFAVGVTALPASAAHRHVDTPSGCHAVAYQAGANSGGNSNWNKNVNNQSVANSPVMSSGECGTEEQ